MEVSFFDFPGIALVIPRRFVDTRAFFAETWNDREFREKVADVGFVQDNHSRSTHTGTARGFQFRGHRRSKESSCVLGRLNTRRRRGYPDWIGWLWPQSRRPAGCNRRRAALGASRLPPRLLYARR